MAKVLELHFSIGISNEYSGLISLRIDWFDLLTVQETLSSPVPHNSKASILQCSVFFMVQLSHLSITNGKTVVLIIWSFISKVMSLIFNMLSKFLIAFLPRSKHLLISWLRSPSALILEPKKIKSVTVFTFSTSTCHEVMEPRAMILVILMLSFKTAFSHSSISPSLAISPSSRGSLVVLHFLPLGWYHLHIWGCWYVSWESWFQLVIYPAQHFVWCALHRGIPGGSVVKNPPADARDAELILGLERSPRAGNGNPL